MKKTIYLIGALMLILTIQSVMAQNLVGFWKLDQDLATIPDEIGGNDLNNTGYGLVNTTNTYIANCGLTVDDGTAGCYDFGGVSSSYGHYDILSTNLTAGNIILDVGDFNILFWAKTNVGANPTYELITIDDDGGDYNLYLYLRESSAQGKLLVEDYNGVWTGVNFSEDVTEWHLYGINFNSSNNKSSVFIDGVEAPVYIHQDDMAFDRVWSGSRLWVGTNSWTSYDGSLKWLQVYDEMLTGEQMLTLSPRIITTTTTTTTTEDGENIGGNIIALQNLQKATAKAEAPVNPITQFILNIRAAILRLFGIEV